MHYLLGLAALVIGAVIATRRTRPMWFVVLTGVLVGVGALLAILNYTRVTDGLGIVANNVLGWVFVGLSLITMLSAVFVLERRGERGEELPPLIGDNPFDGDTDDSDDLAPGQANPDYTAAPAPRAQYPGAPAVPAAAAADPRADAEQPAAAEHRAAAGGSGALAGNAGAAAATAAAFGDGIVPTAQETAPAADVNREGAPRVAFSDADAAAAPRADFGETDSAAAPRADFGETGAHAPAAHTGHPHPSDDAVDGTTVVGADPDIATPPASTDVDAAPEGGTDEHGTDRTDRA